MSFLSLIIVFLLEQLQPLSYRRFVAAPVAASADFVEARINVGSYRHGLLAWLLLLLLWSLALINTVRGVVSGDVFRPHP